MQPIPIVACFAEFLPLLCSSAGIHVELTGCFGSSAWCNMKHFPINLVLFSWILLGKMVLYPSKFILLLSYIKSSVKLRVPVPETAMHAHAMTPPPCCCVASVILCLSLLRTLDCQSITPAFWKLLGILQTRLLGFIFWFVCHQLLLFSQPIR